MVARDKRCDNLTCPRCVLIDALAPQVEPVVMRGTERPRRPVITLAMSLAFALTVLLLPSAVASAASDGGLCPVGYERPDVPTPSMGEPATTPVALPPLKGPPPPGALSPATTTEPPPPMDISLRGTWRELPPSPFASANPLAVWAGDRMMAFDPRRGRTATYYPPTRRWEEHQRMPGKDPAAGETINGLSEPTWTGSEVILLGYRNRPDSIESLGYAFDPARGRWRAIAPPPIDAGRDTVWTGSLLLVAAPDRQMAAYDPAADCWLRVPEMPLPELPENARTWRAMEWQLDSVHWTGDELLAVVATEWPRVPIGVVSFDPGTWGWEPGPQAPPSSHLSRPVYAEGRLWFLFGDPSGDGISNATYDPVARRWRAIETDCAVTSAGADWTGRLIVQPRWERRAWDPSTGQCYRVPRVKDRARTGGATVWTGREYVIWSGAYGDSGRAFPDGIVYRPRREAVTADTRLFSDKLKRAISSRRRYGFDTDPQVVREIMRDPWQPASRRFGFPMTAAEESSIWSMSAKASQAGHVQPRLRKLPTYAGLWQDQRSGGDFAIALTDADPEVLSRIDGWMAGRWRLVIVPFTEKELKRALWRVDRVTKRLDPDAILWAAAVELSAGGLELMYDPDDVERMRARRSELEKRLGVPVRISSGRVRDL